MDYTELASALLDNIRLMHAEKPQRHLNDSFHGEAFVLKCIAHHGDYVLPGEISSEMNVSSARIAQTLNSMEKKGLITRRIDENDRRKILVSITPKGRETAEEHQRSMIKSLAEILSLLGEDDAREFVRITGKIEKVIHESDIKF